MLLQVGLKLKILDPYIIIRITFVHQAFLFDTFETMNFYSVRNYFLKCQSLFTGSISV